MRISLASILCILGLMFSLGAAILFWPKEQALRAGPEVLARLAQLRDEPKFIPAGVVRPDERIRMEPIINDMLDRLIAGLSQNPRKTWALEEIRKTVASFYREDTEIRERCVSYVLRTLTILGIDDTNRVFYRYFLFI